MIGRRCFIRAMFSIIPSSRKKVFRKGKSSLGHFRISNLRSETEPKVLRLRRSTKIFFLSFIDLIICSFSTAMFSKSSFFFSFFISGLSSSFFSSSLLTLSFLISYKDSSIRSLTFLFSLGSSSSEKNEFLGRSKASTSCLIKSL